MKYVSAGSSVSEAGLMFHWHYGMAPECLTVLVQWEGGGTPPSGEGGYGIRRWDWE